MTIRLQLTHFYNKRGLERYNFLGTKRLEQKKQIFTDLIIETKNIFNYLKNLFWLPRISHISTYIMETKVLTSPDMSLAFHISM